MAPSDMTPGELWTAFAGGYIDYETLIIESHKGGFCRNLFRFTEESLWDARALRIIADELDRRSAEAEGTWQAPTQ